MKTWADEHPPTPPPTPPSDKVIISVRLGKDGDPQTMSFSRKSEAGVIKKAILAQVGQPLGTPFKLVDQMGLGPLLTATSLQETTPSWFRVATTLLQELPQQNHKPTHQRLQRFSLGKASERLMYLGVVRDLEGS
eukprot:m.319060 g.319060  ORF g.319060 m.319060 type:complete len:135 (-) comp16445_c0_seq70:2603-3007(-)